MKIDYCIGVHNEDPKYIKTLLDQILKYKDAEDEIIIVDDYSTNQDTLDCLASYEGKISVHKHALNGNFAEHRNYALSLCKGDWVFEIDMDEVPHVLLLQALKEIILNNPTVEAYRVPRLNVVPDITPEDMQRYGWRFYSDEKNPTTQYINLPDYQTRIHINKPEVRWINPVHETLTGFSAYSALPFLNEEGVIDPSYCLFHLKSRERQVSQNDFYNTLN